MSTSSKSKRAEQALRGALRSLPAFERDVEPYALFESAERHGVASVVLDAWRTRGLLLPTDLARRLDVHAFAREIDHRAHLELLAKIDERFARAGLHGVVLKGPLFAERYYARPSGRATSDLDLLVEPSSLEHASAVLVELGYVGAEGPEEDRVRREHHHLHFAHPESLPLELHFHGYTGFGRVLPSSPLVERRLPSPIAGMHALGVLSPEDELVFLAVHAAAHRYIRLGWLYDLRLLVATLSDAQLTLAAERASRWGFARVLAFTASLLVEQLDAPASILDPLGAAQLRAPVARRTVREPANAVLSSATRMLYTVALCDKKSAAARYVLRASAGHVKRLLHLTP